MAQKPSSTQPSSFTSAAVPSTFQNTSLIDASLTQLPIGDNPLVEPLYSTVVPRSQRQKPLVQTTGTLTHSQSSEATRVSPTIPPRESTTVNVKPTTGEGGSTTNLRMRYLEQMVSRMDKEKKAMEEEFGRQRKKFMKEMLQAESETNLAKDSISRHAQEIERLNLKLLKRESINCGTTDGEADGERVQLTHEIDILRRKLQEVSHEQSVRTEQLRSDWLRERQSLETQLAQIKLEYKNLRLSQQPSKRSTEQRQGSKSPRDRSKSPVRSRQTETRSPESAISLTVPGGGGSSQEDHTFLLSSSTPAVNFTSESSLESSMIEAAKESQILRAVVIPLEEEIDLLKIRLREAQERLEVYEDNPGHIDRTKFPSISPVPRVAVQSDDITEKELLEKLLNQEREARHDLEMHSDGLRRQKTILLSDIGELKQQLQDNQSELKKEQESHLQLQKTWEHANLKFAQSQETLRNRLIELEHKIKREEIVKDDVIQTVEDVTRPCDPLSPDLSDNHRRRSLSWSSVSDIERVHGGVQDQENESSWKPIVEQLQTLIVRLRKDLDIKEVTIEEYKQQLERVQGQLMQELDEKEDEIMRLKADHDKIKAGLIRERKQREDLRRQLVSEKETMKLRIEQFQSNETKFKQKLKNVKDKFTEMKHATQKEMTQFTDERVRLHELLEQKSEEYVCLKGVHSSEITEFQNNIRKLKQLEQEAEMNVASTMEELTRIRDRGTLTEKGLKAEISDLKQLLTLSGQEKATLKNQLDELQNDLIEVQKVNNKLEKDCNNLRGGRTILQEKSKAFIEDQQQKMTQLTEEKTRLEDVEADLQRRLVQLKQQLTSCEANQKDFVELSQTLQVRLAEMEVGGAKQDHHSNNEVTTVIDDEDDLFT